MGSIYPAALSHFAIFCPALGPDEDNTHEQLLFYAAATLPAFYPYSPNDYFARNVHLRRRSSGGPHETAQTGRTSTTQQQRNTTASGTSSSQHQKTNGGVHSEDNIAARERVVPLDTKLREIGLGAALIAFSGSFGARRKRFHTVHSEKRRTLIFEPEPGVIIQLSVVLPRKVRPYGKEKDAYSIEFLDAELSDRGLRAWLWQEYWAFRILFGPLTRALAADASSRSVVKRQLDGFFGSTLWSWDQRWDPRTGSELDLLHALQPLPLLPIGSISLGGFDEFWHDLSSLTSTGSFPHQQDEGGGSDNHEPQPLVHDAVVLWRGQEIVWSSWQNCHDSEESENLQMLRALVAWSRAVFAPAFDLKDDVATAGERTAEARRHRAHPHYAAQNPDNSPVPQSLIGMPATPSLSLPTSHAEISEGLPEDQGAGGWSLPGTGWLWNWGGQAGTGSATHPTIAEEERTNEGSDDDSRSINSSAGSASAGAQDSGGGGLAQVLSRAVNALVEPRPPTPPEVDPMFATEGGSQNKNPPHSSAEASEAAAEHYTISASDIAGARSASGAMLARDSDAESLRSVGSLASVRSTRTTATASVALSRQAGVGRSSIASPNRGRSNTIQHGSIMANALAAAVPGWQPGYMRRRAAHARAPSVATSAATAESVMLRDDTRVSSRSWWPAWMWGSAQKHSEEPLTADSAELQAPSIYSVEAASGIVPESTFLYTGDYPFPGMPADQPRGTHRTPAAASDYGDEPTAEAVQNADDVSLKSNEQRQQETASQLGVAMEDQMPAAYEHGVGVDCSRGIVLAPRAIPGMLYDTRLVRTMFHSRFSARNAAERPLFVGADKHSADQGACSRTLAYKFGDMLILVFGSPPKPDASSSAAIRQQQQQPAADFKEDERQIHRGRRGRRARVREKAAKKDLQRLENPAQSNIQPFSVQEAQDIEQAILRYAESLQAATWRDSREVEAQRKSEVQLAEQRRIPPYVYQSGGGVLPVTRTRTGSADDRKEEAF
ncbi:hypothetical protein H4R20_000036 [Coemansia guatemalensis]|uniref:CCZ1/INTU/HSP4 first Longin domain-containing protein n=1 Tax=Coemansia guatemalensis TaxID=2761395 RepID=A0A9W8LW96_9FUNG|nr:hypothetical protein H4R20_000036 [Coemansia guatemalensis]